MASAHQLMPPWLIVALRLTGLGWYVALCIVIGILGGLWLGELSGQVALFVLIGTVLGSVIAFYGVYRMVLRAVYGSNQPGSTPPRRDPRDTDGGY